VNVKSQWSLEWLDLATSKLIVPESFVVVVNRPKIIFKNNDYDYYNIGKPNWGEMTVIYFDVKNDEGGAIFDYWINQQITDNKFENTYSILRMYSILYNNTRCIEETFELDNSFVSRVSYPWRYSLEVTIRYDKLRWKNHFPVMAAVPPA